MAVSWPIHSIHHAFLGSSGRWSTARVTAFALPASSRIHCDTRFMGTSSVPCLPRVRKIKSS